LEEQIELFTNREVTIGRTETNPMIKVYGKGPEGTKCRNCNHLTCVQYANKYYKCELRGTKGASTDHNYYFSACGKYVEVTI
jgi:hypothetical protein